MTTETKSFKMITFFRRITKSYCENAEMTYGEFSKHLRTEGLGDKKITDDETIKKMWDQLANSGDDHGDGEARVDTEQEQEYDDCEDDQCWDNDEDIWDFIENFDFEDCFPEPEDTRTPEEKEKAEKEKAKAEKEFFEKRAAEMKKHAEEYAAKQKAERIANVPKNLLNVISMSAELYQHPHPPPNEDDVRGKISVMRTVARQRILGKMKELVAELEEVAKW